jgi:hypothetical protein
MKMCDYSADKANAVELEFPDWSGMDDSSARVDLDAAFQLCEQYRAWFPELAAKWQPQESEKCLVEFVL